MSQQRVRRRFSVLLLCLLLVTLAIFVEECVQAYVLPNVNLYAASWMTDLLKGGGEITIGRIRGGILGRFEVEDVTIRDARNRKNTLPLIEVKSAQCAFTIWDLLKARFTGDGATMPIAFSRVNLIVRAPDRSVEGLFTIEGSTLRNLRARGIVSYAGGRVRVKGNISWHQGRLVLGKWSVGDHLSAAVAIVDFNDRTFSVEGKVDHAPISKVDIVCSFSASGLFAPDGPGGLFKVSGLAAARSVVANYRPFYDVECAWSIDKDTFSVERLDVGRFIFANGSIALKKPYAMDVSVEARRFNLVSLAAVFPAVERHLLDGIIDVRLSAKGAWPRVMSRCTLLVRNGRIGDLVFASLSARFAGIGSMVTIEEGRINRGHGVVTVTGNFDLKNTGKGNFFESMDSIPGEEHAEWEGWAITKDRDGKTVSGTKSLGDSLSIAYTTDVEQEELDPRERTNDLEIRYEVCPNQFLKMKVGQQNDFIGMEHKERF